MNSKATYMVIISPKNSLSKIFWWDLAKAGSCQWRNSTFGEQLCRDTITKICCSNSEAWFKILVNAQYSFLSTKRCPFTFLHAYSVNRLARGTCAIFISACIQSALLSLWDIQYPNPSFGLFPLCLLPSHLFMKPLQRVSGEDNNLCILLRKGLDKLLLLHHVFHEYLEMWSSGLVEPPVLYRKYVFFLNNPNGSHF